MSRFLDLLRLKQKVAAAELDAINETIAEVESAALDEFPSEFDPRWKDGNRLTPIGRQVIERCLSKGMPQAQAARLFRLSLARVHLISNEVRGKLNGADADV